MTSRAQTPRKTATTFVGLLAVLPAVAALAGAVASTPKAPPAGPALSRVAMEIVSKKCLSCHGATKVKGLDLRTRQAALKGGEHGPAIVPGKPEESAFYQFIAGQRPVRMPPGEALPQSEKEILRAWIAAGAEYPMAAPALGWSPYSPLKSPPSPKVKNATWVRNPIDAFVLARLEAKGLSPAPPASPRELIRRLTFDLTGLPPTPQEVDAFLSDKRPGAYERLVDRLLASPRYGEHWARHWLDVARFAESQGFERDKIRDHAWRYRDYVIKAFNQDLPYDRFVREQIAGDLLPDATPESIVATGFLTAGPWDEVGAMQPQPRLRKKVREDELEDMVSVVGQTFLGLTVNCSRCHDHKFDPIPQRDYYRIESALAGVRHGDRALETAAQAKERLAQRKAMEDQLNRLSADARKLDDEGRKAALATVGQKRSAPDPDAPKPDSLWTFEGDAKDSVGGLDATLLGGATIENGSLVVDARSGHAVTKPLTTDVAARTLEVWVRPKTLLQQGGGVMSIENDKGTVFDGIVYGERQPRKWVPGSEAFFRTRDLEAEPEDTPLGGLIHIAITYDATNRVAMYRNGVLFGVPYVPSVSLDSTLRTYRAGNGHVLFGARHLAAAVPGSNAWFGGSIEEARLYHRALNAGAIERSFRSGPPVVGEKDILQALTPVQRTRRGEISVETKRLQSELTRLVPASAYAANTVEPGVVHVLTRGDSDKPAEAVSAGGLSCLPSSGFDFTLAPDAPEAQRRLRLADWLVSPSNPLTPRVMVNRVWQYHFGRGLVATSNDFGVNGDRPTHPELLDWLAAKFQSPKSNVQTPNQSEQSSMAWSIKALHRLIVTSSTYRQSGRPNSKASAVDAENLLLWRMSPRRLTAEEVGDAMLSVSGQMNLGAAGNEGGPGFRPFSVVINNTHFYTYEDRIGPDYNRRSIYRTVVNSGGVPLLEALDCPDPSVKAPRRSVTTTPLQALSLLNSSFVLRQSNEMAKRMERVARNDTGRQVEGVYRLAFGRSASPRERERATEFVQKNGMPAFCRVMLNASEFVYVR